MTLSSLIREYVELKIQSQPGSNDWATIESRNEYHDRLEELEAAIDAAVEPKAVA